MRFLQTVGFLVLGFSALGWAQPVQLPGEHGEAVSLGAIDFTELAARRPFIPPQAGQPPRVVPSPAHRQLHPQAPSAKRATFGETATQASTLSSQDPSAQPFNGFQGKSYTGWIPPDTQGAVGPAYVMVAVNGAVLIQDRHGNTMSTASLNSFWTLSTSVCVFDPRVSYDSVSARWILIAASDTPSSGSCSGPDSRLLIAVSATSDPRGTWYRYSVAADPSNQTWADFPNLGFNGQWIVISANMFPLATGGIYAAIFAFNKSVLYANGTPSFTKFVDTSATNDIPVAMLDNTLGPMYFINGYYGTPGTPDRLRISTMSGSPGFESLTLGSSFPTGLADSSNFGFNDPQLGGPALEGANPTEIRVVGRNGYLWCVQKVALPATSSPSRSAAQWWQVVPTTGQVVQFGRVDDENNVLSYDYPSIAVNRNNDVVIGYSAFSASTYPAAGYSVRVASDAAGVIRQPLVYRGGDAPYSNISSGRNRWGDYSATVVDPLNDVDIWTLQEYAASPANTWGTWWAAVTPSARLANLSTRGEVLTGNSVMIGGFIIGGLSSKTVVVQGIGPSLANYGITNPLPNPTLTLVRSSDNTVIATNDNWQSAPNASQIQASGFAPSNPYESAIMVTLAPGAYTAILSGVNNSTGVGLVAMYEVDHPEIPFIDLSTRGPVLTGQGVMIAGINVQGSQQPVVIQGIGPSLANYGITNPLPNPTLTLVRSSDGAVIATNDNWQSAANASAIQASGFAPTNALESAIMITLPAGNYTAILQDASGATGTGLIAVYQQ